MNLLLINSCQSTVVLGSYLQNVIIIIVPNLTNTSPTMVNKFHQNCTWGIICDKCYYKIYSWGVTKWNFVVYKKTSQGAGGVISNKQVNKKY